MWRDYAAIWKISGRCLILTGLVIPCLVFNQPPIIGERTSMRLLTTAITPAAMVTSAAPSLARSRTGCRSLKQFLENIIAFKMTSPMRGNVRRHINWNNQRPDLKEDLAHLVQDIKRRIYGIASAGFRLFSV